MKKSGPRVQQGMVPQQGTIGHRIWKARHEMKLTQERVTADINASGQEFVRSQLTAIEHGYSRTFRWDHLVAIAKALDVSLAYIAGETAEYGVYP